MNVESSFRPPVQTGFLIHFGAAILVSFAGAAGIYGAANADVGPVFLLYLLPAVAAMLLGPLLAYQAFALRSAEYTLSRDGVRLRWGLRREDIPIDQILWLRPAQELPQQPRLPWLRLPGLLVGSRRMANLGNVEYMAADSKRLVLMATPERVYAISPEDPQGFIQRFQRAAEMGSFTPIPALSIYPSFLIGGVWRDSRARSLLLAGLFFSVVLLVWVSLAVPSRQTISLGFNPDGEPRIPVPAVRLMLLPVLNSLFFLNDLLLGLFFYRREHSRDLALLLWSSGAASAFIFCVAVFFILRIG